MCDEVMLMTDMSCVCVCEIGLVADAVRLACLLGNGRLKYSFVVRRLH